MFANLLDVITNVVHQITVEIPVQQWVEQMGQFEVSILDGHDFSGSDFWDTNDILPTHGKDPFDF